jgi:Tfp pilus assembly PilM family ATPase
MSLLAKWLASPPPDAAVEIASDHVSAAALSSRGGGLVVHAHASEPLPAGAVVPSLTAHNIPDQNIVAGALRTALARLGTRPARVALVIPDLATKVSLVKFEQLPGKRDDLDQLVRWQVRKSAPFPIEEACVSYTAGARDAGGGEFIVVMARQSIIEEYENVCSSAGVYAGLVDLSTFSVANLFLGPAAPSGDWLVVYVRPQYTSIAIFRGQDLIFFRNRPEGEEEPLADLVHQTTMYYQDRLAGVGFSRVLIGGAGRMAGALDHARRTVEERLGMAIEPIDPTRVATLPDRISVTPDLMDVLAPLAGILMRTRQAVAA